MACFFVPTSQLYDFILTVIISSFEYLTAAPYSAIIFKEKVVPPSFLSLVSFPVGIIYANKYRISKNGLCIENVFVNYVQ